MEPVCRRVLKQNRKRSRGYTRKRPRNTDRTIPKIRVPGFEQPSRIRGPTSRSKASRRGRSPENHDLQRLPGRHITSKWKLPGQRPNYEKIPGSNTGTITPLFRNTNPAHTSGTKRPGRRPLKARQHQARRQQQKSPPGNLTIPLRAKRGRNAKYIQPTARMDDPHTQLPEVGNSPRRKKGS